MKLTIVAKVDNKPGVVSRISGLFTRRGYNIEGLVTSVTDDPKIYHLTITVLCTEEELELLLSQLQRIAEVIEVKAADHIPHVTRELMLIRIKCGENKTVVLQLAEFLKCKIVGASDDTVILEATGDDSRLQTVINALKEYELETVRSGSLSILI